VRTRGRWSLPEVLVWCWKGNSEEEEGGGGKRREEGE
jgi:hypothetical protein